MALNFDFLKPKKCRFYHRWQEWTPVKNPDDHVTPAMYRCGVWPVKIRTCECGEHHQLHLEKCL